MKKLIPVRLPPGRARLATRPSLTGSSPTTKTMGIVVVAALAANAAAVLPVVAITATCRRTNSAASAGSRSILTLGPAVFDRHVLALDIAGFLQALAKCAQAVRERVRRCAVEKPDHRHRRLLRARRERPRRRAAEQRDELAPLHSITSSARASSVGGTSRPSALFFTLRDTTTGTSLSSVCGYRTVCR